MSWALLCWFSGWACAKRWQTAAMAKRKWVLHGFAWFSQVLSFRTARKRLKRKTIQRTRSQLFRFTCSTHETSWGISKGFLNLWVFGKVIKHTYFFGEYSNLFIGVLEAWKFCIVVRFHDTGSTASWFQIWMLHAAFACYRRRSNNLKNKWRNCGHGWLPKPRQRSVCWLKDCAGAKICVECYLAAGRRLKRKTNQRTRSQLFRFTCSTHETSRSLYESMNLYFRCAKSSGTWPRSSKVLKVLLRLPPQGRL